MKWISVNTKTPPIKDIVIAWSSKTGTILAIHDGNFWRDFNGHTLYSIIFWMPLPKTPKQ